MTTAPLAPDSPDTVPGARHVGGVDITERKSWTGPTGLMLLVTLLSAALITWLFIIGITDTNTDDSLTTLGAICLTASIVLFIAWCLLWSAFAINSPGETKVVQFFGRYIGTVRQAGMVFTVPLASRKKMLVRVRNFETNELKVNDADGNPINIAAIIVWQVADTAKAAFAVEDYQSFVQVQSEAALRHVATTHPYDGSDGERSLRGSTDVVSAELATEVAERVAVAGVEVLEVRISNLAYAPEIAQAMLQRQQAGAIIAAREKIVEGAVSMVEQALTRLEDEDVVVLDDERRAAMVSNLLVVLCGESRATPVLNAGSLYS